MNQIFAVLDFYSLPMVTFELKIFLTWLFKFFSEKKKSETIFKVNFEQNLKKLQTDFFRGECRFFFFLGFFSMFFSWKFSIVLKLDNPTTGKDASNSS